MKALVLLLPVLLAVAGCSNIRSKQPVGDEPVDLTQSIGDLDLSALAGTWIDHEGGRATISITDPAQGRILYTPSAEDESPRALQLRRTDDHLFVNFEPDQDGERAWLLFGIQGNLSQILYWEPDRAKFRELIAQGAIKGTNDPETTRDEDGREVEAKNPGAIIDDPQGGWVDKMVAGDFGVLFDWRNPTVLRREGTAPGADVPPSPGEGKQTPE